MTGEATKGPRVIPSPLLYTENGADLSYQDTPLGYIANRQKTLQQGRRLLSPP